MTNLSVSKFPRKLPVSRAFLLSAKDAVLGKSYELSVAFVSSREVRRLNKKCRGVDAPTDILSFSLSADAGEIVLCASEARRQAPSFRRPFSNFFKFLLIHGLVHLKGYRHGSRMEREEEKFRKKFNI